MYDNYLSAHSCVPFFEDSVGLPPPVLSVDDKGPVFPFNLSNRPWLRPSTTPLPNDTTYTTVEERDKNIGFLETNSTGLTSLPFTFASSK